MKYLCVQLLLYFLLFCISCEQSQTSKLKRTAEPGTIKPDSLKEDASVSATDKNQTKPVETKNTPSKFDSLNFKKSFSHFLLTIQQEDAAAFNKYIHPEFGLYIIEQPGAVPKFTQVKSIQDFQREYQHKPFFSIKIEFKNCDLKAEALPSFDCNGQGDNPAGFSKQGCFVAEATAFQKNEAHHYASLPAAEIRQIEKLKPLLNKTVLHTASAFRFHFGNIKGNWYVLFIELIAPCSA